MRNLTYIGELQDAESDEDMDKVIHHLIQEWQLTGGLVCSVVSYSIATLVDHAMILIL